MDVATHEQPHTSPRVPYEPTTSASRYGTARKPSHTVRPRQRGVTSSRSRGTVFSNPYGPCLGMETPEKSTPITRRRSRECHHPRSRRADGSRSSSRRTIQSANALDLRGERTWKRSLGLGPTTDLRTIARDVCVVESSFPNRYARVIPAGKQNGSLAAFHGVRHPTTLAEAGSDLHRACLPRLCCAFRFSQPLDALFRPQPLQPCFMPVTPLGFHFQRFSLPDSGIASRRVLPFMPF
jgi:hypothetical protein